MKDLYNFPMGTIVGDPLPGSPELSVRGSVRTGTARMTFVRHSVPSFKKGVRQLPLPLEDRELVYQVWYPIASDDPGVPAVYTDYMGRIDLGNLVPYRFDGRAHADAVPDSTAGKCPVVIISHGYPGSRMLLCNLAENLSSKGYVVFSIDHKDNSYTDFIPEGSMESALVHRTMDQRALLNELSRLNSEGPLAGLLDLEHIGLIGFSMGGFGALRTIGAKVSSDVTVQYRDIAGYIAEPEWQGDARIKAAVLFAPATFLIDTGSLGDITVPTLWVCGTADRTVGYDAVHEAWKNTVHSHRTMVSYTACGHNVANNPAPPEALDSEWTILKRWADPVWDTARLNTLNIHFVTAFFAQHLRGEDGEHYYTYLDQYAPLPGFVPETDTGVHVEHIALH